MRKIAILSCAAAAVAAGAGAAGSGSALDRGRELDVADYGVRGQPLRVLVAADRATLKELARLKLSLDQVLGRLESDLRASLGRGVPVHVEKRPRGLEASVDAVFDRVARRHGVPAAARRVLSLEQTLLEEGRVESPELDDARARFERALAGAMAELKGRRNLAGLPCEAIGIDLQGHEIYGGRRFPRERWAIVYSGLAADVFPPPAYLTGGRVAVLDFSAPEFDRYRRAYREPVRRRYVVRFLANSVKEQLGYLFGLRANEGALVDAMRSSVSLARAEHFARDARPTRFNRADRRALLARLKQAVGRCA